MDITAMITRYQRIASSNDKQLFRGDTPVDRWLNIIRQHSSNADLCSVSRTFKYIRLFNKDVVGNATYDKRHVNVAECYELLEKLSKGEAPKELSPGTKRYIQETLKEIAREVKTGKVTEKTKVSLKNLQLNNNNKVKTYGKRKHVDEIEGIELLNPLKLPLDLLNK